MCSDGACLVRAFDFDDRDRSPNRAAGRGRALARTADGQHGFTRRAPGSLGATRRGARSVGRKRGVHRSSREPRLFLPSRAALPAARRQAGFAGRRSGGVDLRRDVGAEPRGHSLEPADHADRSGVRARARVHHLVHGSRGLLLARRARSARSAGVRRPDPDVPGVDPSSTTSG